MTDDQGIDDIIIQGAYKALDALVAACLDASGQPKCPTKVDIMNARKMLTARYSMTLVKPKSKV